MRDKIDRKRHSATGQGLFDVLNIGVESGSRARIERRHGADDAGPALCDDQFLGRRNEHGPGHDGDSELSFQLPRQVGARALRIDVEFLHLTPVPAAMIDWCSDHSYAKLVNMFIILQKFMAHW